MEEMINPFEDKLIVEIATLRRQLAEAKKRIAQLIKEKGRELNNEALASENVELRAKLAALEAANEWKPASQPPPDGKPVFIVSISERISIATNNSKIPQWSTSDGLYYHGDSYKFVTHWRELPAPPKEEK